MFPSKKITLTPEEIVMLVLAGYPIPIHCRNGVDCGHIARSIKNTFCVCCYKNANFGLSEKWWHIYNCDGSLNHEKA